jgi:hypothetical protein
VQQTHQNFSEGEGFYGAADPSEFSEKSEVGFESK